MTSKEKNAKNTITNQLSLIKKKHTIHRVQENNPNEVIKDDALLLTNTNRVETIGINENKDFDDEYYEEENDNPLIDINNQTDSTNSKIKKNILKFLDSFPVIIFMMVLTLYALFMSDIQAACIPKKADFALNVMQCILMGIFTTEFLLFCYAKKDYLFSFFFFLDLLSTVSLIFDLDWFTDDLYGYSPTKAGVGRKKRSKSYF